MAASQTTSELTLPVPNPAGSDSADVDGDLNLLAARIEAVLTSGHVSTWQPGDYKESAQQVSHGRWLLCDGTEKTQAEVETACGLAAGKAAALVALLGTGSSSMYGSAAAGKVRLPDPRGRSRLIAGAGPGLTARTRGQTGGAETVTLTGDQSGIKAHTHGVTDPGHGHSGSQAAHSHGATQGSHTHTASQASHSHVITVGAHTHGATGLSNDTVAGHQHGISSMGTNTTGSHSHDANIIGGINSALSAYNKLGGAIETATTVNVAGAGDHSHTMTGAMDSAGSHSHTISGSTASATPSGASDSLAPAVTVASASAGAITIDSQTPAVTVASATTGLTVSTKMAEDAASAHENLPPFIVLGNVFIRI